MDFRQDVRLHLLDYWRVVRIRLGLVVVIFALVLLTTGVFTYFTPRQYRSFATIEVAQNMTPVRIFDVQGGAETGYSDPRFSQTQFQIILRKGVLYPVIERLNLQARWGTRGEPLLRETAYDRLRGMVSLEEVRNTNLIQIDVYSTDPTEAALLANTIADVYMQQRIEEQQGLVSKGLDQLRDEVKQKEQAVSEAYAEASKLRTEGNITDPNPDSLDGGGRVEDSSVMSNQEKVNDRRSEIATLRSRVDQLDKLKGEDLMRVAGQLNLNDPIIVGKLPLYQNAQAQKGKLLKSGLGSNHPDVKAVQAEIDIIGEQLKQQIDSIRKGFMTQLAIAEDSLKATETNLQTSQSDQQSMKTASARYVDAKYKYIQERKLLELAKTRLSTESMERTMPQKPAFIRDAAEPALFPSRPKVFINLLLGAAAGILLGVAAAFFLEYLDTSVKTMDEIEKYLDLSVLAVIPKGVHALTSAEEEEAEPYRILKTNIDFIRKKINSTAFSVISGGAGEGKSTTVCNLAGAWAAAGQRVLIVDADMRRPSQHRLFEVDNRVGLGNYLKGNALLDEIVSPTTISDLYLIPAGPTSVDVSSLLNSPAMSHLIAVAKERFDVVIFDCPPLLGVSDASIICGLVDASIMVIHHRRFPRAMLLRVKKAIANVGGHILGVVLNNVDVRLDPNYQYYTSYSQYYRPDNKQNKPRVVRSGAGIEPSSNGDAY
jgi:succinoglycan biosynthesis transport protein ExoP